MDMNGSHQTRQTADSIVPGGHTAPLPSITDDTDLDVNHTEAVNKPLLSPDGARHGEHPVPNGELPQVRQLQEQINVLEKLIYQSHMRDIAYHFTSKKAVIQINLLAGLARGIGLTIGTALFLAVLFYLLSHVETLPIIGEYIAELIEIIQQYRQI
jgi:hypothetical protein